MTRERRARGAKRFPAIGGAAFAAAAVAAACGDGGENGGARPDADAFPDLEGERASLARDLDRLSGVRIVEGPTEERAPEGYLYAELRIEQAIDHHSDGDETFEQKLYLLHRSEDAPTVMVTAGYDVPDGSRRWELARVAEANQIVVEHRHFGDSQPEPFAWEDLTIEQAARDHHEVVSRFSAFYEDAWATTGISKGGMAATYHRRFFPDDVDATVPYVAPISFEVGDARYDEFLRELPGACRADLRALQEEALARRDETDIVEEAELFAPSDLSYELNGFDFVYESGVANAEWNFWQNLGYAECDRLPAPDAGDGDLVGFLDSVANFSGGSGSDEAVLSGLPYRVQAATELGYPYMSTEHLEELLREEVNESPFPTDLPEHDPAVMRDIWEWTIEEGSELLFIYGEYDPWTAGAYEVGEDRDAYRFTAPEGSHRAGLSSLERGDRAEAARALERWLDTEISIPSGQAMLYADEPPPIHNEALPPPGAL